MRSRCLGGVAYVALLAGCGTGNGIAPGSFAFIEMAFSDALSTATPGSHAGITDGVGSKGFGFGQFQCPNRQPQDCAGVFTFVDPTAFNAVITPNSVQGVGVSAGGINSTGLQVGYELSTAGVGRAFTYQAGASAVNYLSPLPGDTASYAADVNDSGAIVGTSQVAGQPQKAVTWAAGATVPTVEPSPLVGANTTGVDINDAGDVLGQYMTPNGAHTGVVWGHDGSMHMVPNIGGAGNAVSKMNASGQVVGQADAPGTPPVQHGVLYELASDKLTDLGLPAGATGSFATSINDGGLIVGGAYFAADSSFHAFEYKEGAWTDLNTLFPASGVTFNYALAVSASGKIVVVGTKGDGTTAYFIITPAS